MDTGYLPPGVTAKVGTLLSYFKAAEAAALNVFYRVFDFTLKMFLKVFPRPSLKNEDLNRAATVVAYFLRWRSVTRSSIFPFISQSSPILGCRTTLISCHLDFDSLSRCQREVDTFCGTVWCFGDLFLSTGGDGFLVFRTLASVQFVFGCCVCNDHYGAKGWHGSSP